MKALGFLLGTFIGACVLFAALLKEVDVSSSTYASYEDAMRKGALGDGKWLPGDLPTSAMRIEETHDGDTNEVWFVYQSPMPAKPGRCKPVSWTEVPLPNAGRSPRGFLQNLEDARRREQTAAYACTAEAYRYHLAYDPISGSAYGWSLGD